MRFSAKNAKAAKAAKSEQPRGCGNSSVPASAARSPPRSHERAYGFVPRGKRLSRQPGSAPRALPIFIPHYSLFSPPAFSRTRLRFTTRPRLSIGSPTQPPVQKYHRSPSHRTAVPVFHPLPKRVRQAEIPRKGQITRVLTKFEVFPTGFRPNPTDFLTETQKRQILHWHLPNTS